MFNVGWFTKPTELGRQIWYACSLGDLICRRASPAHYQDDLTAMAKSNV